MESESSLGKVHVITGPGKGKTTAAFGLALRASGHGLRVCVIQFMKTGMTTGEVLALKRISEIQVHQFGTGKFIDARKVTESDRRSSSEAWSLSRRYLSSGDCDLLILDEVNVAAHLGLVDTGEMLSALRSRMKGIEVVLTGRDAPEEFVALADYVSVIDDKKHPYRSGLKARKGIEW